MSFPDKIVRPWSSSRTLALCDGWLGVDKPAECSSQALHDPLAGRLKVQGLVGWGSGSLPVGVSGAHWLARADAKRLEAPAGLEQQLVLGVSNYQGPKRGTLKAHEFRVRQRREQRVLLNVRTSCAVAEAAEDFSRAGYELVGWGNDSGQNQPRFSRALIHVLCVKAQGLPELVAPLPGCFDAWLAGKPVRPPQQFEAALFEAGLGRWKLAYRRQAFRLLGEGNGEISGLTVDRYGDFAVIAVSTEAAAEQVSGLAELLMDGGARGVYVKHRARKDLRRLPREMFSSALPHRGDAAPEVLGLQTGPVQLQVRLGQGHSTGLFLDQAANWVRIAERVRHGSLLNLFCYTGAFTVLAAQAGATATVSVDLSGSALRNLRENLKINGLSSCSHRLLKGDAFNWLKRAGRRSERYDAIVLDPPSFGTRAHGVLSLRRDYGVLLEQSLKLLAIDGHLLSVVHHRALQWPELCGTIEAVAAGLGQQVEVQGLAGDWDCPTLAGVSATKNLLIRRLS